MVKQKQGLRGVGRLTVFGYIALMLFTLATTGYIDGGIILGFITAFCFLMELGLLGKKLD